VKRRIVRDAKERGYDLEDVLYRYEHHVSPFYNKYILPLKDEVDLVIPNNKDFFRALDVLKVFIQDKLRTPEDIR
jgi:uridine kinase